MADGTYRLCPSPVGVTIGTGPVDPSVTCGTAIVGPLSIGTTGRAAVSESDEEPEPEVTRGRRFAESDAGSKDLFERQKDIDYLDIPSFLRTQAD